MVNGHPEYIDKALEQRRFQGGPCLSDPGDPKGTPIISDHDHERGPKELTLKHNRYMVYRTPPNATNPIRLLVSAGVVTCTAGQLIVLVLLLLLHPIEQQCIILKEIEDYTTVHSYW